MDPLDLLHRAERAVAGGEHWEASVLLRAVLAQPGPLGEGWVRALQTADRIADDGAAVAAARRLHSEAPADVQATFLLASALTEAGLADEAVGLLLPIADRGLLTPNQNFKLTRMLMFAGRIDEAQGRARGLLASNPESPTLWERIAQTKTFVAGDPDIAVMRRLLARTPESRPAARSAIAAALAKACVDVGDDVAAEAALETHAAAQRRRFPFDPAAWLRAARATLDAFRSLPPPIDSPGSSGPGWPIFIIGPPRSGTSLLDQVFSRHPLIKGGGELRSLALASRVLGDWSATGLRSWLDRATAAGLDPWLEIGRRYRFLTEERFGAGAHFTDKLLSNLHRVGAIARAMPDARVIHLQRDPLDVAWSCWRSRFDAESAWSASPEGIACFLGFFEEAMRTWHELHPGRIVKVAYEDLVRTPAATIPRLLDACGLPDDPATREPHLSRRPVTTMSYAQVREPIHVRRVHAARDFPQATRRLAAALERAGVHAAGPS